MEFDALPGSLLSLRICRGSIGIYIYIEKYLWRVPSWAKLDVTSSVFLCVFVVLQYIPVLA